MDLTFFDLVSLYLCGLQALQKVSIFPHASGLGMRLRKLFQILVLFMTCAISAALSHAQRLEVTLPDDPAAVIAVVGKSNVLLGDLLPQVDARIAEVEEKSGQQISAEQLREARLSLVRGLLGKTIQAKMMRESFLLEQVGSENADKREEADAKLSGRARQMFHEAELPELKEQYGTNDLRELDGMLRKKGSSLLARQRDFVDQMLGHLYIRGNVNRKPEVSLSEIITEYEAEKENFFKPERARWEQLTVLSANFPNEQAARDAIQEMGREAVFGGSMQAVARDRSQEPFASKGGVHDWTSRGSLASEKLDAQVFSLPLNKISGVIQDSQGFHIVRVLEREEAGYTASSELQDELRAKIRERKIETSQRNALDRMRAKIPVWTLFPDDIPGSKPLPVSIARGNNPANR
jgi:parvulin-like peptidyl-prolyl isomerase